MIFRPSADLKGPRGAGNLGQNPMLPATVQFIIALIARAINERMAPRVDYLQEEVRVLKGPSRRSAARPGSVTLTEDDEVLQALNLNSRPPAVTAPSLALQTRARTCEQYVETRPPQSRQ